MQIWIPFIVDNLLHENSLLNFLVLLNSEFQILILSVHEVEGDGQMPMRYEWKVLIQVVLEANDHVPVELGVLLDVFQALVVHLLCGLEDELVCLLLLQ